MVHRREVNGEAVVFGNQGALWGNAMTWWDHDTGSVWSQPLGEAILGPRKGERLELLPSSLTTWDDWTGRHPETAALDAPNASVGRHLDDVMLAVQIGSDVVAFPVPDVRAAGVVNARVGDAPVAVVVQGDDWMVYSRTIEGGVVELEVTGTVLQERAGSAQFEALSGLAVTGESQLAPLPAFTVFPEDYPTFFPQGFVWTPSGLVSATG